MGQLDINLARSVADERRAEAMRLAEHRIMMQEREELAPKMQRAYVVARIAERMHVTALATRLHLIEAPVVP